MQIRLAAVCAFLISMSKSSSQKFNIRSVYIKTRDEDPEFFSTDPDPDPAQLKKTDHTLIQREQHIYLYMYIYIYIYIHEVDRHKFRF